MTDYGDGPERGNRQTWAFMAAECARLLRERDEARQRLRAEVERLRLCIKSLIGAAHDYVPEESWAAFVAHAPEAFAGEDDEEPAGGDA